LFGLLPSVLAPDDTAGAPDAGALRHEPPIVDAPGTSPAEARDFADNGAPHAPPPEMMARRAIGGDQRQRLEATLRELTECRALLDRVLNERP
jgi:hypothetical protein